MKQITIKLYEFEELSREAKDHALEIYRNEDDHTPFLTDDLREYVHEELKEAGYKVIGRSTSANPSIRPHYSLSHSQGDGLMFEGTIEDPEGNIYTIKHVGHYAHERSTNIVGYDKNDREIDTENFEENFYIPLCKQIAQRGYDELEYADSEEFFAQICEASNYLFEEDGTIRELITTKGGDY